MHAEYILQQPKGIETLEVKLLRQLEHCDLFEVE
jgi:hypothetical protein